MQSDLEPLTQIQFKVFFLTRIHALSVCTIRINKQGSIMIQKSF